MATSPPFRLQSSLRFAAGVIMLFAQLTLWGADEPSAYRSAALQSVKELIARTTQSGKKPRVWANVIGKPLQVALESLDGELCIVKYEGNPVPLRLDKMTDAELCALISGIIPEQPDAVWTVLDFAIATEQLERAEEYLNTAAERFPSSSALLASRMEKVKALRAKGREQSKKTVVQSAKTSSATDLAKTEPEANARNTQPRPNPYDRNTTIDFSSYDASIDPGVDPVFVSDLELNGAEDYAYRVTKPGDHPLPEKTYAFQYDASRRISLAQTLAALRESILGKTGVAIYLSGGSEFSPEDLKTAQSFNKQAKDGGLGFTTVESLYVYNLKSMEGGVQTPEATLNGAFMWSNGWRSATFQHIAFDDMEEVRDGTFCDCRFRSISLRGAQTIGVMAFGGPRAGGPALTRLYLPSATRIKAHAFRRNKSLIKVNLPKVKVLEPYSFDDCDRMEYFNAPQLEYMGRNALNDSGALVSINMPRLQKMEVACFTANESMRVIRLPALVSGFDLYMNEVRIVYLPELKHLNVNMIGHRVESVYLPKLESIQAGAFGAAGALRRVNLPMARVIPPGALDGLKNCVVTVRGEKKRLP